MSKSTTSTSSRQLAIKTGVVTRLVKEVAMYKQEALLLKTKADKLEADGEDEYEVRQQRRVEADSVQMIPDSEQRLAKALEELEDLIDASEDELNGTEELEKAKQVLEFAKLSPKE